MQLSTRILDNKRKKKQTKDKIIGVKNHQSYFKEKNNNSSTNLHLQYNIIAWVLIL